MKSVAISLALGLAAGAATIAFAQDRIPGQPGAAPERGRPVFSQEDRAAFADGRIAGLRAALRLTADQDKLWPPVEQALRDLAKQRAETREKARERWASFRADREAGRPSQRNIPEDLKARADRMANSAASLRKLADASAPLYAVLDEGQKRRLGALMHVMGREGMRGHRHGWHRHGMREDHRGWRGERRERRGWREDRSRDFAERDDRGDGYDRGGYERRGRDWREMREDRFESRRFQ